MPIGRSPTERLALKLRSRCLRELSQMEGSVVIGTIIVAHTTQYGFTHVEKWSNDGYRFAVIQEQVSELGKEKLLVGPSGRERRVRDPHKWEHMWTANVIVYPNLDVVVEDAFGKRDNDDIERLVLSCALRRPD